MTDHKKLWDSVLAEVELLVSTAAFSTWFKDTSIEKFEQNVVYLSVPNTFVKEWLASKYHKFILKSLRGFGDDVRAVEYLVSSREPKRDESRRTSITPLQGLPLPEEIINKDDNLNPRYTFETFVVGPFNELVHAAAQTIIKQPLSYNPLFIYGNTGHGKTHLIQAIGNQVKHLYPQKKVYYLTSEKFALDYINSVQVNKVNQFKEKYRKYDILIMDDIQFLSSKEKTQEELFHLFNFLYDNNKQIVFSSDKHPDQIPYLEQRLKSRFVAGLTVDIPVPDRESRVAIIKSKTSYHNFSLSEEVIEYLATAIEGNIRELEGVINAIVHHSRMKNRDLSLIEVKNIVKLTRPRKTVSVKDLIKIIADFYNIDEASIYEKTRRKEIVKPRQVIMYILREDFSVSYPSIGQKLGGRDHTTVIHSCEKIKNDLQADSTLNQELGQIRALL